jgi:hypothetical protein
MVANKLINPLPDSSCETSGSLSFIYFDEFKESTDVGRVDFSYRSGIHIHYSSSHNGYSGVIHWQDRLKSTNGLHDPEAVLQQIHHWIECDPSIIKILGSVVHFHANATYEDVGR